MPFTINNFTLNPLSTEQRENLVRPFMRWVGGKQRLVGKLLDYLPDPNTYDQYFEPFLGAGSLFLAGDFPNAVLNDLNAHLINTYKQVKNRPEELHALIQEHANTLKRDHRKNFAGDWGEYTKERSHESYYYQVRRDYNANLEIPEEVYREECLEQAARFLFLIHSNYNGVFRVNKKGEYNVPFGKKYTRVPELDLLRQISSKLHGAEFTNESFEELEPRIGENAFVYLDPPYPDLQPIDLFTPRDRTRKASFTGYNAPPFGNKEQNELAAFANRIRRRGAKVMISTVEPVGVDEKDQRRINLRDWYPERYWCYHATKFKRTLGPKKEPQVVQELILTSYETEECEKGRKKKQAKRGPRGKK